MPKQANTPALIRTLFPESLHAWEHEILRLLGPEITVTIPIRVFQNERGQLVADLNQLRDDLIRSLESRFKQEKNQDKDEDTEESDGETD